MPPTREASKMEQVELILKSPEVLIAEELLLMIYPWDMFEIFLTPTQIEPIKELIIGIVREEKVRTDQSHHGAVFKFRNEEHFELFWQILNHLLEIKMKEIFEPVIEEMRVSMGSVDGCAVNCPSSACLPTASMETPNIETVFGGIVPQGR